MNAPLREGKKRPRYPWNMLTRGYEHNIYKADPEMIVLSFT